MLKKINPIISPELLKILAEMGHTDEIVICDGNMPVYTCLLYTSDAADE